MNKRRILFFAGLLLLMALGYVLATRRPAAIEPATTTAPQHDAEDYYTCPMHPSVRKDAPGVCPVCGMALVKKLRERASNSQEVQTLAAVRLSATQRVLANVETITPARRTVTPAINAVGLVEMAEPNFKNMSARFAGRVEKLYLAYTGQAVRAGDPVAEIYSPEAISAQQEYVLAWRANAVDANAHATFTQATATMLAQARQKLVLMGLEPLLAELERTQTVRELVTLYSPIRGTVLKKNVAQQDYVALGQVLYEVADLSLVWIYLDVYENDLRFIKLQQAVRLTSEAYPNEVFTGRVTFIAPVIANETRTVRVRVECANPAGKLKLGLYVKAQILTPQAEALAIPASAVLITGKRNLVWIEVAENAFEPREVVLGAREEDYYEILRGLHGEEKVVVRGGFLLDSESQLQSAAKPHQH